jgi:anti-sigma B factor antagonist
MEFTEETIGNVKVLHLQGKLIEGTDTHKLSAVFENAAVKNIQFVVMDFQDVRLLNSAGIGEIIACISTLRKCGGDVYFANLHDESLKYMQITKIDTVVKAFDSIEAAVADIGVS